MIDKKDWAPQRRWAERNKDKVRGYARKSMRKILADPARREKHNASVLARYWADPEKARTLNRAWCKANPDKVRAHSKKSYRKNRLKRLKANKAYAIANSEQIRVHKAAWYQKNKARISKQQKEYRDDK